MAVLTPQQARTFDDICKLPRDHVDCPAWWGSLGEAEITFAQQKRGESSTGMVRIPRAEFDAFVRWYTTGRLRRPTSRRTVRKRNARR